MATSSVIIILLMLLFSAFFSGSEMAFLASNKLLLEINRKRFPRLSKIIDIFMENPGVLISTILVGNNIALVVYGLEFGNAFGPMISEHITSSATGVLFVQTVLSTIVIIVTAEFLPKTLIQFNPSTMLNVLALPLMFFYIVFYPVGRFMQFMAHVVITKVLRSKSVAQDGPLLPGRVDLDNLLSKQADAPKETSATQEAKLMKNALDFSKIKVRDCAVPRPDVVAIDVDETVDSIKQQFIETGYSKILVYQDTIDNIIGYVHVSELFKGGKTIRSMMSPIVVVPETMGAKKLLSLFTGQHKSIALVVDEFGGTAGMVTLEDVLEEIFGEIDDEHDVVEYEEKQLADGEYIFAGRLEIDYLNDKYDLRLPVSEDYDTLGGMILAHNQSIPKADDEITIEGFRLRILTASHSRIGNVKLVVL